MRKWAPLVIALLLFAVSAHAAIGGYGGEGANVSSTSLTLTQPSSLTGATLIVNPHVAEIATVNWTSLSAEPAGLSLTSGWTKIEGHQFNSGSGFVDFFRHCYTAGDPSFVASWTGATGNNGLIYWVVDANCTSPTSNFLDTTAGTYYTNSSGNTGALTPTVADEDALIIENGAAPGTNAYGNGTVVFQHENPFAGVNYDAGYIATRGSTATQVGSDGSASRNYIYEVLITPTTHPQYPKLHGLVFKDQSSTSSPSWTINSAGSQSLWVDTGDIVGSFIYSFGGGWHFSSSSGFHSLTLQEQDGTGTCCSFQGMQFYTSTGQAADTSYSITLTQSIEVASAMFALKSSNATPDNHTGAGTNTAITAPTTSAIAMSSGKPEWVFTAFQGFNKNPGGWSGTQPDMLTFKLPTINWQVGMQFLNSGSGNTTPLTAAYTGTDQSVWQEIVMPNTLTPAPATSHALLMSIP